MSHNCNQQAIMLSGQDDINIKSFPVLGDLLNINKEKIMGENFIKNQYVKEDGFTEYRLEDFLHESCKPIGMTVGDFNGDGKDDIICFPNYGQRSNSPREYKMFISDGFRYHEVQTPIINIGSTAVFSAPHKFAFTAGKFKNNNKDQLVFVYDFDSQIIQHTFYMLSFDIEVVDNSFRVIANLEYISPFPSCNLDWFHNYINTQTDIDQIFYSPLIAGKFNNDLFSDVLCRDESSIITGLYSNKTHGHGPSYSQVKSITGLSSLHSAQYYFSVQIVSSVDTYGVLTGGKSHPVKLNEDELTDIVDYDLGPINSRKFDFDSRAFINANSDGTLFINAGRIHGFKHNENQNLDVIYTNLDGIGADDAILIQGNNEISFKVQKERKFVSLSETEPNQWTQLVSPRAAFPQHILTLDINGDGRKDLLLFHKISNIQHPIVGSAPDDNTFLYIYISDIGEKPVRENVVATKDELKFEIQILNIDVPDRVFINRNSVSLYTKQSAYVYNNVSVTQSTAAAGESVLRDTSFDLAVSSTEDYTETVTIGNLRSLSSTNSHSFSAGFEFRKDWSYEAEQEGDFYFFGAGVKQTSSIGFSVHGATEHSWEESETNEKSEETTHEKTISNTIEASVSAQVPSGECVYARMDFIKYNDFNVPYTATAFIRLFNITSNSYVKDRELVRDLFAAAYGVEKNLISNTNNTDQVKYEVNGNVNTALFTNSVAFLDVCDIDTINNLIGVNVVIND